MCRALCVENSDGLHSLLLTGPVRTFVPPLHTFSRAGGCLGAPFAHVVQDGKAHPGLFSRVTDPHSASQLAAGGPASSLHESCGKGGAAHSRRETNQNNRQFDGDVSNNGTVLFTQEQGGMSCEGGGSPSRPSPPRL